MGRLAGAQAEAKAEATTHAALRARTTGPRVLGASREAARPARIVCERALTNATSFVNAHSQTTSISPETRRPRTTPGHLPVPAPPQDARPPPGPRRSQSPRSQDGGQATTLKTSMQHRRAWSPSRASPKASPPARGTSSTRSPHEAPSPTRPSSKPPACPPAPSATPSAASATPASSAHAAASKTADNATSTSPSNAPATDADPTSRRAGGRCRAEARGRDGTERGAQTVQRAHTIAQARRQHLRHALARRQRKARVCCDARIK